MNHLGRKVLSVLLSVGLHGVVGAALMLSPAARRDSVEAAPAVIISVEMVSARSSKGSVSALDHKIAELETGVENLSRPTPDANPVSWPPVSPDTPPAAAKKAVTEGGAESGSETPGPAPAAGGDVLSFEKVLLRHIQNYRGYPARARRERVEGTVLLRFAMNRQGKVTDAWIEHGSGSTALDAEALATIQRAQPLPSIPADLPESLSLALPIAFNLN